MNSRAGMNGDSTASQSANWRAGSSFKGRRPSSSVMTMDTVGYEHGVQATEGGSDVHTDLHCGKTDKNRLNRECAVRSANTQ
jgi:hypothetical protein